MVRLMRLAMVRFAVLVMVLAMVLVRLVELAMVILLMIVELLVRLLVDNVVNTTSIIGMGVDHNALQPIELGSGGDALQCHLR